MMSETDFLLIKRENLLEKRMNVDS